MGDCLKDCLATDSKKTNIKQVVNKIMKEASIIMLLTNPGTIAKIQTKKDFAEIFSVIDNFMKVVYKILTKHKLLDDTHLNLSSTEIYKIQDAYLSIESFNNKSKK